MRPEHRERVNRIQLEHLRERYGLGAAKAQGLGSSAYDVVLGQLRVQGDLRCARVRRAEAREDERGAAAAVRCGELRLQLHQDR
jgi:hypothetical protein